VDSEVLIPRSLIMKAAVIHNYGAPDVLIYESCPDPKPAGGEVVVRVAAAGVNPVDLREREGGTKDWRPVVFPGVLGWDLAGTIVGLGEGVRELAIGESVFGWAYHTYAELCAVKATLLAPVPAGLDLDAAAALPLVSATGCQLITVAGQPKAGQTVLVAGANGAVGRCAVFAAKDCECRVIAGVRGKDVGAAAQLGADQVVALDDEAAMGALAPVDLVANCVRGPTATALLGKVKPGGLFASVTGVPDGADTYPRVRTTAFVSKQNVETYLYAARAVLAGHLQIPVAKTLPLSAAAEGHVLVAKGGTGKIVLKP
jgi:NADPH:quinone reductase-like Zn-dependent oxidoreductase